MAILWADRYFAEFGPIKHLHGRGKAEVVQELGQPDETHTFTLANISEGPVRDKILELYPKEPENGTITFLEMYWIEKGAEKRDLITRVWLHQVDGQWLVFFSNRHYKRAGL
jgi:hypothetical protein